MAENYLGDFPVDIADTPYAEFGPAEWALYFVEQYSQIDGSHHKTWTLDQIARVLKGTPVLVQEARWGPSDKYPNGLREYRIKTGEPSPAYLAWVEAMMGDTDEDGDREYDYDAGIAP